MKSRYWLTVISAVSLLFFSPWPSGIALATVPGTNSLVSVTSLGSQENSDGAIMGGGSLSKDGRYVVFYSDASNLVSGDTNGDLDVFVRDTSSGATERDSVDSSGNQANNFSQNARISGDGRYVVFTSPATNLTADTANGQVQVYLRDRQTGTTELISKSSGGTVGNGGSNMPDVSDDGRFVTFDSYSSNLITGDTNAHEDVFVRDRLKNTVTRVSVADNGTQGNGDSGDPQLSCDGRYVAYESLASNLVPSDTNGSSDIFVTDQLGGVTSDVTIAGDNGSAGPAISCNGRYVVFESAADNLVSGDTNTNSDVFVYDRQTATMERESVSSTGTESNNDSGGSTLSISDDGRYVAFTSSATNLVASDTNGVRDVFLRDRQGGTTELVSRSSGGTIGNGSSYLPTISADGQYVVYASAATNLVGGDANGHDDIFESATGASAGCTF